MLNFPVEATKLEICGVCKSNLHNWIYKKSPAKNEFRDNYYNYTLDFAALRRYFGADVYLHAKKEGYGSNRRGGTGRKKWDWIRQSAIQYSQKIEELEIKAWESKYGTSKYTLKEMGILKQLYREEEKIRKLEILFK